MLVKVRASQGVERKYSSFHPSFFIFFITFHVLDLTFNDV